MWVVVGQDALSTGSGAASRTSWRSSKEAWMPARPGHGGYPGRGAALALQGRSLGLAGLKPCMCKETALHTSSWHEILTLKEQVMRVES